MRRLFLALSAISLLACGDSTGTGSSAVGTWNLITVNNSSLPVTLLDEPDLKIEVLSETLIFADGGAFTNIFTSRTTESGTVTTTTETDTGTWSQAGSTVTTIASDGTPSTYTISGNRITLRVDVFVVVYARQ